MIRPVHPDDAQPLFEMFHQEAPSWCDYFDPVSSLASFRTFVETQSGEHYRLVALRDNRPVGLGIMRRLPAVRLAHMGQIDLLPPTADAVESAGEELLQALLDLADNWLNLRRLEATIPCSASHLDALLRHAGFDFEGEMEKTIQFNGVFYNERALARLRDLDERYQLKRPPIALAGRSASGVRACEPMIRQMEERDINDLYELFRAPENCRTTMQLPSQELWMTRKRVTEPPPGMTRLVAECDGRVVGTITLRPRAQACRSHLAGIGMMVHPGFWGQGIGSQLMEQVIELADHELGLTRVQLQVHTDNPAGIRLYKKYGFIIEGTKRFHTYGAGGWADTYFMARVLD